MTEYFIGVDVGTGSVKAVAVSREGIVLSNAQIHYQHKNVISGLVHNPEDIYLAFIQALRKLASEISGRPLSICLSTAMHSLILIGKNNEPLTPMITWADDRAADIAEKTRRSSIGEMLYEATGTPLHATSPLFKIMWFRKNAEELFRDTHRFISIKEYIWYKLFGVYEVDHSIASASGLMNIIKCEWDSNALALAGITSDQLSSLVSVRHSRVSSSAPELQDTELKNAKFIIGSSDGCMANLGSFATEKGTAALTIGTSGAIRIASRTPIYNYEAMTFNYRLDENLFICGGPTNNGGIILKWYVENLLGRSLQNIKDYDDILGQAKSINAGSDGLIFLPYLLGERAPHWNNKASGVFFGIDFQHGQPHFTRAVIEGIGMALYDISRAIDLDEHSIQAIHASGGFVHSKLWLQILADIFGCKLMLMNTTDASALGAAYLAMRDDGVITDIKELNKEPVAEFLPNADTHELYRNHFKRFRDLYASVKVLMNNKQ